MVLIYIIVRVYQDYQDRSSMYKLALLNCIYFICDRGLSTTSGSSGVISFLSRVLLTTSRRAVFTFLSAVRVFNGSCRACIAKSDFISSFFLLQLLQFASLHEDLTNKTLDPSQDQVSTFHIFLPHVVICFNNPVL